MFIIIYNYQPTTITHTLEFKIRNDLNLAAWRSSSSTPTILSWICQPLSSSDDNRLGPKTSHNKNESYGIEQANNVYVQILFLSSERL